jgi:DNA-binding NarL/FixJ family response regulator
LAARGLRPKYIVVSAFSHYAITAIRSKVGDYLLKPVDLASLKIAIKRVSGNQAILNETNNYVAGTHLTKLEHTVLKGMLTGSTSKQMAAELNLSSHTVDTYRRKVLKKLGVKNKVELISRNKF